MKHLLTVVPMVVMVCAGGEVRAAAAQGTTKAVSAVRRGEIVGTVTDDHHRPLIGVVVSAVGATTAFAITDASGRYGFRTLAPGPYLLRAHLDGYSPASATLVQVNGGGSSTYSITLTTPGSAVLTAGVGGVAAPPPPGDATPTPSSDESDDNHSELAWRLRHMKRGVLNDTETTLVRQDDRDSFLQDSLDSVTRAVTASARMASAVLSDMSGELNLLTTTSFDRPQRLFENDGGAPHGVAHLSLLSPQANGDWSLRGALTQGDLSSWVLAGSYTRHSTAAHAYEAGVWYTMQRYLGGNAVALAALADGSRTAGEAFAYDNWHVTPGITVTYGGKVARYGYLEDRNLVSPRASVTMVPAPGLRVRAAASRRETAPGAEELKSPATAGLWLPPERTFSPLEQDGVFVPERVMHYEVAAEQDLPQGWTVGGRAFRQRIDDQSVTVFGVTMPRGAASSLGHYYVASAGNIAGQGWGASISHTIAGTMRGSVDYTATRATWIGAGGDFDALARVASGYARQDRDVLRDLTSTFDAELPATATRMFIMYRLSTSRSAVDSSAPLSGTRFDLQIQQRLPFLRFSSAQWAMLIAVRNVFNEDAIDASTYDELMVVRPPKRVIGGVTVRF